ncbi:MAG TPA: hypothetical protein VFT66_02170 [Roseiflexaceae bacterium]|nr:hypothetical protein [Roseiflexaceae bacterium]
MSEPTFKGNDEQQALAAEVYHIMTSQGVLFADDAPIRQTLANLADFFSSQRKTDPAQMAAAIDSALRANEELFKREERSDDVLFVTSKRRFPPPAHSEISHMFRHRLYEPDNPLPIDDLSVVVTTTRPALTTVEPVFISDYWQRQVGLIPDMPDGEEVTDGVVAEPPVIETAEEVPAAVEAAEVVEAPPVEAEEEVVEIAPVVVPVSTVMVLPNGVQIDLRRPVADLMAQNGPTLVTQLRNALEADPLRRIVLFGNDAFPEAQVANFGKNDLRRIRDYLQETGEPLLDTQIIADVFYHNARQADYEAFRFAIDYRLSREKDFEFVGVEGARLWSARGLPAIGSKRVKASEMGQIAGYLEEGFDDSLEDQSAEAIRGSGSLIHVLSFFEWEYGILPFTRALAALLPSPLLSDQRTVVLRVESPQQYRSMLVELRLPTGNRGGWLSGLEEFFHEFLVPGALITLTRTEEPHVFSLTYEEQAETEARLLVLDEKRNKFAFNDITYYCEVDMDMLPSQRQYGRLRNLKSLPMNERRKSDVVLEHVFDTIGDPIGTRSEPQYRATNQELYMAMNVLRPTTRSYLQHLLNDGEYFETDGEIDDAWIYTPPPQEVDDEEDEEEEDDYYDDDE